MDEEKLYTLSEARLMVKVEELEREIADLQAVIFKRDESIEHWREKEAAYHKEKAVLKIVIDERDKDIRQLRNWVNELLEKSRITYERWYFDGIFGIDTKEDFAKRIEELSQVVNRIKKEYEK